MTAAVQESLCSCINHCEKALHGIGAGITVQQYCINHSVKALHGTDARVTVLTAV